MTVYYRDADVVVYHGDCLDVMASLADSSVDSVVTDPPYALAFMNRSWDSHATPREFQLWCQSWAAECLRVLKPGGHMLAFGGTRTSHRLACAVEDAGFEIRDSIAWIYGSGFPKNLDVSKAIDRAAGAERQVLGVSGKSGAARSCMAGDFTGGEYMATKPNTAAAKQWQGWGTALKPAMEPIVVARKPLVGTVAQNVARYGTGALNIDACRVGTDTSRGDRYNGKAQQSDETGWRMQKRRTEPWQPPVGRWPPNVVLDEATAQQLDEQTGISVSRRSELTSTPGAIYGGGRGLPSHTGVYGYDDSGGASRFFPVFKYTPKAPRVERPTVDGVSHPTCKPVELMRWLVRLVTPPSAPALVCSDCGKDVFGVWHNIPAKGAESNPMRHSMQAEAGGSLAEETADTLSDMRQGSNGRSGAEVLQPSMLRGEPQDSAPVQGLWDDVPSVAANSADVFANVRTQGDDASAQVMRVVQQDVSAEVGAVEVLRSEVRGGGVGRGEAQGAADQSRRVQGSIRSGSPDGDENWLSAGTSEDCGRDGGSDAMARRSSASPQRDQDGQQAGESGSSSEIGPRPDTEAAAEADYMSPLRRQDQGFGPCTSCGGALTQINLPGVVLDCFAGTGTTGEAAIHEHKQAILIERETEYLPLIVARLRKPVQVGFDFDEVSSAPT